MRPLLVKNRDTFFPSSARRAMASAETGFRRLFARDRMRGSRTPSRAGGGVAREGGQGL